MPDFAKLRERMIRRQIESRGITDPRILNAFKSVPRELFVAAKQSRWAYDDNPLPIEAGQTISQPYIVALMIEAAGIGSGDKVLEVGAGSGYAAAIMSRIACKVVAIERQHDLAALASERLRRLDYDNVLIVEGDGTLGCLAEAPFDAMLAAASGSHVPRPLLDQLVIGGRLVMPVGNPAGIQELVKVTKHANGTTTESLGGVRFVPLIGEEGWRKA